MQRDIVLLALAFIISSCTSLGIAQNRNTNPELDIFFPRSFGVAVNQVGYMQGSSLDHEDGPWRAGIRRNFDVRDYRPMVEIGQKVGIRFVCLFALAEMDRLNIVSILPHATQAGHYFDNHENIGPEQIEIMQYVLEQAAHIELGVTGVGHEWWEGGKKVRSEWYDTENNQPRDEEMMRQHLEVIQNILGQYGFSENNGHSFPESFSAYGYYWNPSGIYSTGSILRDYGARYASTKFELIPELDPPDEYHGGIDNGILVLDRGIFGNEWFRFADLPDDPVETYKTDIIDSHWANWLATDDFLQQKLNERYVDYFREVQKYPYRYNAKNSEQLYSQWLYKEYTSVGFTGPGAARIDNTKMPDEVYEHQLLGNMVLSIPLAENQHLAEVRLNGQPVPAIFEDAGYGYIYLPVLEQNVYEVKWKVGSIPMTQTVNNTGTYIVYASEITDDWMAFEVKMYGTQDVRFRVSDNFFVTPNQDKLKVLEKWYDENAGELVVTIYGHDIQGSAGILTLQKK